MEILLDTAHLGYSKKNKIPMQNPNEVRMFFIALPSLPDAGKDE